MSLRPKTSRRPMHWTAIQLPMQQWKWTTTCLEFVGQVLPPVQCRRSARSVARFSRAARLSEVTRRTMPIVCGTALGKTDVGKTTESLHVERTLFDWCVKCVAYVGKTQLLLHITSVPFIRTRSASTRPLHVTSARPVMNGFSEPAISATISDSSTRQIFRSPKRAGSDVTSARHTAACHVVVSAAAFSAKVVRWKRTSAFTLESSRSSAKHAAKTSARKLIWRFTVGVATQTCVRTRVWIAEKHSSTVLTCAVIRSANTESFCRWCVNGATTVWMLLQLRPRQRISQQINTDMAMSRIIIEKEFSVVWNRPLVANPKKCTYLRLQPELFPLVCSGLGPHTLRYSPRAGQGMYLCMFS